MDDMVRVASDFRSTLRSNREQPRPEARGNKSRPGWRPNLPQRARLSRSGRVHFEHRHLSSITPACSCLVLSKLGNEQGACAVLCCNCVEPSAAHAPTSEDLKVCAAHRRVWFSNACAPVHKATNDSSTALTARTLS